MAPVFVLVISSILLRGIGRLGVERLASWREAGRLALLITMLPANVHATLSGIPFRGEAPTALWLRVPIQVLFLLTIWWTSITGPPPAASPLRRIQLA
jgi:uncharacterized membrane protein